MCNVRRVVPVFILVVGCGGEGSASPSSPGATAQVCHDVYSMMCTRLFECLSRDELQAVGISGQARDCPAQMGGGDCTAPACEDGLVLDNAAVDGCLHEWELAPCLHVRAAFMDGAGTQEWAPSCAVICVPS